MAFKSTVAVVGALLAGGCVSIQAPKDFLVVDKGIDEIKAVTPDDAKLWVRTFDDPDGGDLAFWSKTLKLDLTKNRGYVLLGEEPIEDKQGRQGAALLLETTLQGKPTRELLALFVLPGWPDNRIRVVELVADKETFERVLPDVKQAIATLD
ncbi:MAG: hypothetical protein JXR83_02025 [Deltaproteobacteria bacterium]|nr:hypothetical protein [Deltaproteobacteria bacterium]